MVAITFAIKSMVNGKAVSLKTKNQKEATQKTQALIPVLKSTTTEMISAHIKHARGLAKRKKTLALNAVWEIYSKHPWFVILIVLFILSHIVSILYDSCVIFCFSRPNILFH